MNDPGLTIADRWPALYNWIRGGNVSASEVGHECRDVLRYLGFDVPARGEQLTPEQAAALIEGTDWVDGMADSNPLVINIKAARPLLSRLASGEGAEDRG